MIKSIQRIKTAAIIKTIRSNQVFLTLLLVLAAIHGLLYVFLVPPWQHYDEPGHVEYASLIAKTGKINHLERDPDIRRQILISMVEHDFFTDPESTPDIKNMEDPVHIGIPQIGDPPIYYLLAAFPIRFLNIEKIENQMLTMRLVSLLLYLGLAALALKFAQQNFKNNNPVRFLLPLFIVLLPSLADQMTAASNDPLAILLSSLFIYLAFEIIRKGIHFKDALLIIATSVGIFFAKSSAWPLLALLPVTLLFGLFHQRKKWAWVIILVTLAALLIFIFDFDDAGTWFRDTTQLTGTRTSISFGGTTTHAIQLERQSGQRPPALYQRILPEDAAQLSSQPVVIGAWIWAEKATTINLPFLFTKHRNGQETVHTQETRDITESPQLFFYETEIPQNMDGLYLALAPGAGNEETNTIYIYAPFLAPAGSSPVDSQPVPQSDLETWPAYQNNVLRNPFQKNGWPRFSPLIYQLVIQNNYQLIRLPGFIYLLDLPANLWYIEASLGHIFRTFWALLGWGHVHLPGRAPYRFLLVFTAFWLLGSLAFFIKRIRKTPWVLVFFSLSALLILFLFTLFSGFVMDILTYNPIPVVRFMFPAILIMAAVITMGVTGLAETCHKFTEKCPSFIFTAIFLFGMLALDVIALVNLAAYF